MARALHAVLAGHGLRIEDFLLLGRELGIEGLDGLFALIGLGRALLAQGVHAVDALRRGELAQLGAIEPGDYGWNFGSTRPNGINEHLHLDGERLRVEWAIDAAAGTATSTFGHRVRIAPFFGVMGMPPAEPGFHPTAPPRPTGGNIDCKELVAGTALFLPIAVPGGLFSVGDGHARQGDGEVSTTAIECPVRSGTLTFHLRDDLPIATPIAWTPEAWIAFGFHTDLDEAALIALNAMLDLMQRQFGLERKVALSLASAVVDLRVTQMVNGVRGVHALLRHDAFETIR